MRVRTRALVAAVALCAAWPASAAATIDNITVRPAGGAFPDFLCIGSTTTSPVQLSLSNPAGAALQTIVLPDADDARDMGCPASTHTFEPGAARSAGAVQPSFDRYPAGATLTLSQDGVSVAITVPYGAYSNGTTLLRGLPNPANLSGGVVATGVQGRYGGPAASEGGAVAVSGSVAASNGAAVSLDESVVPARYTVSIAGEDVTVTGLDPLGGTTTAGLFGPGAVAPLAQTVIRPRVGSDCRGGCSATATLRSPAASNERLGVTGQPGWLGDRTVAFPAGVLRGDGFDVAVPPGYTGGFDYDLTFLDREQIAQQPATGALRCTELGPAVTCPGAAAASRPAASASGLFVVPGDAIDVTGVDPTGDSATVSVVAPGLAGSLDDGSLDVRGAARATFTATLSNPRARQSAFTASYKDRTDASGDDRLVDAFPARIANGATATVSGPATGPVAVSYQWNLAAAFTATGAVAGTTYPGGPVAIDHLQGTRTEHLQTIADPVGNFAVQLGDLTAGDRVVVTAANPATHQTTTRTLVAGASGPSIVGLTDGQFVRGTITPTAAGAALTAVLWNGDASTLPGLLTTTAPFPDAIDTTTLEDGPHRLEASGLPGPTGTDYLYFVSDNTPPTGGAGPDQVVAKGATAYVVTGAGDETSGVDSVKVDFGDDHRQTIAGAKFADPLKHIYTRLGTFTVLVTITDVAGNVTSDTAKVRVASSVQPQVTGTIPGKVVHGTVARAKLTGHALGTLEIAILADTGARKLTKRVAFTKNNQKVSLTLLTRGLKVGRYVLLRQFTDTRGVAGPVQAGALRVVAPPKKKNKAGKKTR